MLVNDLANKLRETPLGGDPEIRVGALEADIEIGVVVKVPLNGMQTTPELPGYVSGPVQIVVRHTDPMKGEALANEVIAALETLGEPKMLENYKLTKFWPTAEPIPFPINAAALYELSCNFECRAVKL